MQVWKCWNVCVPDCFSYVWSYILESIQFGNLNSWNFEIWKLFKLWHFWIVISIFLLPWTSGLTKQKPPPKDMKNKFFRLASKSHANGFTELRPRQNDREHIPDRFGWFALRLGGLHYVCIFRSGRLNLPLTPPRTHSHPCTLPGGSQTRRRSVGSY